MQRWVQSICVSLAQDTDSSCCSAWREQSRGTRLEGLRHTLGWRAATVSQALWVCMWHFPCNTERERVKDKPRRKRDCGANCQCDCPAWGTVRYTEALSAASMGKVSHTRMAGDRSTKRLCLHLIGKRVDQLSYIQLNKRQSCTTGGLADSVRADLSSAGEGTSMCWGCVISHCLFSGGSLASLLCGVRVVVMG